MPIETLKKFLDFHGVEYVTIRHSPAYTAQGIAHSAHIPGKEVSKAVIVKMDGKLASGGCRPRGKKALPS